MSNSIDALPLQDPKLRLERINIFFDLVWNLLQEQGDQWFSTSCFLYPLHLHPMAAIVGLILVMLASEAHTQGIKVRFHPKAGLIFQNYIRSPSGR